jgi:ABC-type Na+ efflux pump permease subunit
MSGKLISIVYFYLISAIALVLLVIGVFHSVSFLVNITQYDQYPLRFGGIDRCGTYPQPAPYKETLPTPPSASASAGEQNQQQEQCEKSLVEERHQHKVDDLKNALTFSLIGLLLFGLHFPIALKRSRETK